MMQRVPIQDFEGLCMEPRVLLERKELQESTVVYFQWYVARLRFKKCESLKRLPSR